MRYTYDPMADAVNIIFKEGKANNSQEITNGVILDLDAGGNPLYLEILDASKRLKKTKRSLNNISLKHFKYSKKDISDLVATK